MANHATNLTSTVLSAGSVVAYANLTVSFPALSGSCNHYRYSYAYSQTDGQAELAWMAW